ncbi:hypothetical protein [Desulfosarcina cetonica]|uniref:hypothetical protein n=1 Tax=Desulfosarcina cetonica TaxID=90730 RepID=UPI001C471CB0|nr:hypothetical protein [Desulfosarcina cetonica]
MRLFTPHGRRQVAPVSIPGGALDPRTLEKRAARQEKIVGRLGIDIQFIVDGQKPHIHQRVEKIP